MYLLLFDTVLFSIVLLGLWRIGRLRAEKIVSVDPEITITNVHQREKYLVGLLPLTLLLFVSNMLLKRTPTLMWDFPVWVQYHYGRIAACLTICIFAYMFALAATVAHRTRPGDRKKISVAGVLFAVAVMASHTVYAWPIAPFLEENPEKRGLIWQSTLVTCAPASAANILHRFGHGKTEKEMAEIFNTGAISGTSAAQVVYGMRRLGIDGRMIYASDSDISTVTPPAILYMGGRDKWAAFHAVAFMGYRDGKAEIYDPLNGIFRIPENRMKNDWTGRGIAFDMKNR